MRTTLKRLIEEVLIGKTLKNSSQKSESSMRTTLERLFEEVLIRKTLNNSSQKSESSMRTMLGRLIEEVLIRKTLSSSNSYEAPTLTCLGSFRISERHENSQNGNLLMCLILFSKLCLMAGL